MKMPRAVADRWHQLRSAGRDDRGFNLIEMVVATAILGVIAVALTGIVLSYLRNTVDTEARLSESQDVQLAAAYWQRDVASLGVRLQVPSSGGAGSADDDTFSIQDSVNLTPCTLPSGATAAVTLAWSEYDNVEFEDYDENPGQGNVPRATPILVKVTWATRPVGTAFELIRVRCGTEPSTHTVAHTLESVPVVKCDGVVATCNNDAIVPRKIAMELAILDDRRRDATAHQQTLEGERRQS